VLPPDGRRRSFSLRFRAFGKRQVIKLGCPEDGWTMQMAECELAVVLRYVDLGTWRPNRPDPAPVTEVDLTFHEFASDWFATKELEVEPNTRHGRTWTQRPAVQTTGRRAAIAALMPAGGRASETGAMVWRDMDLANGRFEVGRDKTDAGMREVDMLPLLREILTEHKAASERTGPNDPVFVTSAGRARSRETCATTSSMRSWPTRTGWSRSVACSRCRSGSPRTSCATNSSRSRWRSARTRPT
jgi:hypothetical protein